MKKDLIKVLSMPQSNVSKQVFALSSSLLLALGVSACGDDGSSTNPDDTVIQQHGDAGADGGDQTPASSGSHPVTSGSHPVASGSGGPVASGSSRPAGSGSHPAGSSTAPGQVDLDGGGPPIILEDGAVIENPGDGGVEPTTPGDDGGTPVNPAPDGGTDPGNPDTGVVVPPLESCEVATEDGCYANCLPVVDEHFLNRCTDGCFPFNNAERLPLYVNGELPPL